MTRASRRGFCAAALVACLWWHPGPGRAAEEDEKARAEVRRLQKELEKKLDEIAEIRRRIEAARQKLRKDEPLREAKRLFGAGEVEKALQTYEAAAARMKKPLDRVNALGGAVGCHAALGRSERVRSTLREIRNLLPKLEPDERAPWQKWVDEASKEVR